MKPEKLVAISMICLSLFFVNVSYLYGNDTDRIPKKSGVEITPQRAENFISITKDGAWCWFSDPRAVYHHGKMYIGWTSSKGDIVVGKYNYESGEMTGKIIRPEFQKDDHTAPSLLFLPDGRLMLFFTGHNGGFYYTRSFRPEDIAEFEPVKQLDLGSMLCYTNPVILSAENNRIYIFSRGGYNWKPSYIYSDDLGETWSQPGIVVAKPGASKYNRPYTKVASDGKSAIHFAITDGHPRNEAYNSIYYLKYEYGKFYDAAGNILGDTTSLPIDQNTVPKVYDGTKTLTRAWIWDIAPDAQGNPALVYATFPEESKHFYHYARWNGAEWKNVTLCRGGSWFPRFKKKKEEREPEPHYSGGIYLDHENTGLVYLSVPHNDIFEIERWQTADGGENWTHTLLTAQSGYDNVRPFVVRHAPAEKSPRVLWMYNKNYRHYTQFESEIKGDKPAAGFSTGFAKADVKRVMGKVADWQIDHFAQVKHHLPDWTNGALYAGMMAWAKMAGDEKYLDWLYRIGKKYGWQPYFRMYHADDFVVMQMYLDMYRLKKNEDILIPTKARIDWVMKHPSHASLALDYKDPHTLDRWSWCDALFMAPPVYAKLSAITGEEKYLKFMNKEYKATYEFLYDKQEHLFYRDHRYFEPREANGQKIFWGRGNGWVMAGLVTILQELPAKSKYRGFYEKLFRKMAEKIVTLQDNDGYWHASLPDPVSYPNPETSAGGFYCYALTYGVNTGLLDRAKYFPALKKAWQALVTAVYPDGKLGWVQPIGADPKTVTQNMTEVYGVGAFLLAGSEIFKMSK